jgi:hypothetical protein
MAMEDAMRINAYICSQKIFKHKLITRLFFHKIFKHKLITRLSNMINISFCHGNFMDTTNMR